MRRKEFVKFKGRVISLDDIILINKINSELHNRMVYSFNIILRDNITIEIDPTTDYNRLEESRNKLIKLLNMYETEIE